MEWHIAHLEILELPCLVVRIARQLTVTYVTYMNFKLNETNIWLGEIDGITFCL